MGNKAAAACLRRSLQLRKGFAVGSKRSLKGYA